MAGLFGSLGLIIQYWKMDKQYRITCVTDPWFIQKLEYSSDLNGLTNMRAIKRSTSAIKRSTNELSMSK